MTTYVLFHAKKVNPFVPCIDGLYAAHAAKLALPEAKLVPAMYGVKNAPKLNLVKGDRVFLLDLTYPAFVLEGWVDAGAQVVVLDHHKGAMEDLSGLSSRVLAEFDMNRSGAVIVWEYFHPDLEVPEIFRYVQDYDIWVKKLPDCDQVHLGLLEILENKPLDTALEIIDYFTKKPSSLEAIKDVGAIAQEESNEAVRNAVANHSTRIVGGYVVPFFKCKTKREYQSYSLIGHALVKQVRLKSWVFGKRDRVPPFAVVQTSGGWALRSEDKGLDVSAIAKQLGGGGHRNAAGARAAEWW
jgi:uncharacterized protein